MAGPTKNTIRRDRRDQKDPKRTKLRRKAKAGVPMTAMIDVTFLLLTYFLLTATFRQAEGQLPGTLPKAGGWPPRPIIEEPEKIHLSVTPVGPASESVIYRLDGVDGPLRSPRRLADELAAKRRPDREQVLIIRASRGVRWRYVVEAFNQAVRAKFESIRM